MVVNKTSSLSSLPASNMKTSCRSSLGASKILSFSLLISPTPEFLLEFIIDVNVGDFEVFIGEPALSFLSFSCRILCSSMRSQALPKITMDPERIKTTIFHDMDRAIF